MFKALQAWEVKTLGELGIFIRGVSYKKEQLLNTKSPDSVYLLRANNIQENLKLDDLQIIPRELAENKIIQDNDILFAMSSGSKHIVGKNIILNNLIDYSFGAFCGVFRNTDKNLVPLFLSFYLQSDSYKKYTVTCAKGTNINNLKFSDLESLPIPLPPLETQQKIVAKLESEFAKIESAKSHLEKVKERIPRLKNSLLKSAFSGELTQSYKDERGSPYRHCEDLLESEAHNPQGFCPHSQTHNTQSPQDSIAEAKVCKIVDCHEWRCNSCNDASITQTPNFTQSPNLGGATLVAQNLQSGTNPPNYPFEDNKEVYQKSTCHSDFECNEKEETHVMDSSRDISHFSNAQYDKENNLPQGWDMKTLGEVFEVIGGGTPSTEKSEFWNGDIAWITSANIASENFTITPQKFINQEAIKSSATKLVPKNTIIVVTRVGLGKVGITNVETCFSQDSQALLPMQIVDTKFMAFQIKKEASQFIINSRGTTISGITKDTLKKLKLKIPPLAVQKQIVEILDFKFAALENLEKEVNASLEKLQRLKSSLLNLAFRGELIC